MQLSVVVSLGLLSGGCKTKFCCRRPGWSRQEPYDALGGGRLGCIHMALPVWRRGAVGSMSWGELRLGQQRGVGARDAGRVPRGRSRSGLCPWSTGHSRSGFEACPRSRSQSVGPFAAAASRRSPTARTGATIRCLIDSVALSPSRQGWSYTHHGDGCVRRAHGSGSEALRCHETPMSSRSDGRPSGGRRGVRAEAPRTWRRSASTPSEVV